MDEEEGKDGSMVGHSQQSLPRSLPLCPVARLRISQKSFII